MPERYTAPQIRALTREFRRDGSVHCPRCQVPMDHRCIPPRRDVSYVRDRVWLNCPACHGTLVVDRAEGR